MPNSEFLKERYQNTKLPEDLKAYTDALVNRVGKEVAYYSASDFKELKPLPNQVASKNTGGVPAMNKGLEKPKMIETKEITNGIY